MRVHRRFEGRELDENPRHNETHEAESTAGLDNVNLHRAFRGP
jgi:hypothetical protein